MRKFLAGLGVFCLMTSAMIGLEVSAETDTYSLGDVNMDKSVNLIDLLVTKKECLGLKAVTGNRLTLGDFNEDKAIDARDLLALKKVLLGINEVPEEVFELNPSVVSADFNTHSGAIIGAEFNPECDSRTANFKTTYLWDPTIEPHEHFNYCKTGDYQYVYLKPYSDDEEATLDSNGILSYRNIEEEFECTLDTRGDDSPVFSMNIDGVETSTELGCKKFTTEEDGSFMVENDYFVPKTGETYGMECSYDSDSNTVELMTLGEMSSEASFTSSETDKCLVSFNDFTMNVHREEIEGDYVLTIELFYKGESLGNYSFIEEDLPTVPSLFDGTKIDDIYTLTVSKDYGITKIELDGCDLQSSIPDYSLLVTLTRDLTAANGIKLVAPSSSDTYTYTSVKYCSDSESNEITVSQYLDPGTLEDYDDWEMTFERIPNEEGTYTFTNPVYTETATLGRYDVITTVNDKDITVNADGIVSFEIIDGIKSATVHENKISLDSNNSIAELWIKDDFFTYTCQLPADKKKILTDGVYGGNKVFSYEFDYDELK